MFLNQRKICEICCLCTSKGETTETIYSGDDLSDFLIFAVWLYRGSAVWHCDHNNMLQLFFLMITVFIGRSQTKWLDAELVKSIKSNLASHD